MLSRLREKTNFLHYATREIVGWTEAHIRQLPSGAVPRILDIGLGTGRDLLSIREALGGRKLELMGIESQPLMVAQARREGILTFDIDIERDRFPLADASVDVVMANQVIEHLKELFWFFGEISRILKPGGIAIIGCPIWGHGIIAWRCSSDSSPPRRRYLGRTSAELPSPASEASLRLADILTWSGTKDRIFIFCR